MSTLSNKDQKRISGYGFPEEVAEVVAEVWSQKFSYGGTGEFVSCFLIVLALIVFLQPAGTSSEEASESLAKLAWIFGAGFSIVGAIMASLGLENGKPDTDSQNNRKFYLSRNVLGHLFARGPRKYLGPISAFAFGASLVCSGQWFATIGFTFGTLVLGFGIKVLEVRTQWFLKQLETDLRYVEVFTTYGGSEPLRGEIIDGQCVRVS